MASDMWRLAGKHRCADPPNTDQDVRGVEGGALNSWSKTIRRICQTAGEHTGVGVQDALNATNNGVCPILVELFGSVGKLDPGSALDFYSFRPHE